MKQKSTKLDAARNKAAMKLHHLDDLDLSALAELAKIMGVAVEHPEWKYGYCTAIRSAVMKATDADKLRQLAQKLDDFKVATLLKAAWVV